MKKAVLNRGIWGFYLIATTLVLGLRWVSGQSERTLRDDLRESSDRNRNTLLQYLRPILKAGRGAGRLYYRVDCWTKDVGEGFSFPQLAVEAPSKEKAGPDAVREMCAKCKEVTVTQGRDGTIGIRVGDVGAELLKTKIAVLRLKPAERYNPLQAIMAIQKAAEVRAKMRELGVEEPLAVVQEHLQEADPEWPHLPASMKNVTMDEALDSVAQTFGGLIIYGECTTGSSVALFSIDFVTIADFQTLLRRSKQKK